MSSFFIRISINLSQNIRLHYCSLNVEVIKITLIIYIFLIILKYTPV